jgi:hypothetical protein
MVVNNNSGPFDWTWTRNTPIGSGNGTGNDITGLSAGTYVVALTTALGCFYDFTTLLSEPNELTVVPTIGNYLCEPETGSININVNGGTPLYSYNWTDLVGSTNVKDRADLMSGTYGLTITDSNGCTVNTSATVTGPTLKLAISSNSTTHVSCFGESDGSIITSVVGGQEPFTYLWNDGFNSANRTGLISGIYELKVTDANGCEASLIAEINQPPLLTLSLTKQDPFCPTSSAPPLNNDGSIDLTVNGGTLPILFYWADLPSSPDPEDRNSLRAGIYSVTAIDKNGCNNSKSITLTEINSFPSTPLSISNN